MKILAIERDMEGAEAGDISVQMLEAEARRVWELHQRGVIRELYFRHDRSSAVLVLECADAGEAAAVRATLPLVKLERIRFECIPLVAYPGFERLFKKS